MNRLAAGITAVLAAALCGCGHKGADPAAEETAPSPVVQAATVRVGPIEEVLPLTGTVAALLNREATIIPAVAGQVDAIPVRVGQEVAAGQMVAHLSVRTQLGQIEQAKATIRQNEVQIQQARVAVLQQEQQTSSAVSQAKSAVANARATVASAEAVQTGNRAALQNAQQALERTQTLLSDGLVARKDLEAAQLAVRTAQAQVDAQEQTIAALRQTVASQMDALEAARASALQDTIKRKDVQIARQQAANARGALATAEAQLALYTLRSPLAGRVAAIGANLGETVDTTTKLVTVANLDRMQLQVAVPSDAATRVHAGQPVTFTVNSLPGRLFRSVIQTVGSQVDPNTNAVPAYAIVDNPRRLLQDDQTANVRIVVQHHDGALIVPRSAILTDPAGGEKTVDVIGADGAVHARKVGLGIQQGDVIEITAGVRPGEQVAIGGQYAIPNGTKVTVQRAP